MARYRITETAENDLREILEHVAQHDGLDRALRVHSKLLEAFETLSAAPRAGRVREDVTGPTVRWWTVIHLVIIYTAEPSPIEILRVLHGMRDLDELFSR